MAGKSVNALVERYESARRAAKSSDGAAGSHEVPEVMEGSVQELIDLYNGMARSLPDFPRSTYSRSTRCRSAPLAPAQPPIVHEEELHDTQEEIDDEDGEEEEEEPQDIELKRMDDDEEDERDDGEEEDELSTCDETASINSLSSSFMSDCSYDDHGSEASLYYESEYQTYQQAAETEPESENDDTDEQPVEPTAEPTSDDSLPLEPEVALVADLPPIITGEIVQSPTAESRDLVCDDMSKHERPASVPKLPRALLPSRIPIRRGSTIYAANKKAIKSIPAIVSGGSETIHPSGAIISRPVAVQPQRDRCDPSVPRSPVKKDVCRRFAAANSPSPHNREETKRSERRRPISDFNKPKTPAASPAQTAPVMMAVKKKRASITAFSARFQVSKAPTSSFVDTTIAAVQSVPTKFTLISRNSTPINNIRATRSHSTPTRPREIQTRPPTLPLSAPLPALQSAEISLDRIKSRLFDYENDPKRLEMVAANRARRKSLEARTLQAA